jgi:hexokinase
MIPTFVFGWPTGQEKGDYLAIDLGGTNLRVCLVHLQGQGKFEVTQSKYRLTEEQKQDEGQKLFDFCAESLKTFIDSNSGEDGILNIEPGQNLPLGFTVSHLSYRTSDPIFTVKPVQLPVQVCHRPPEPLYPF